MILERLIPIRWATIVAYLIVWILGVFLIDANWWQPPIAVIGLVLLFSNIALALSINFKDESEKSISNSYSNLIVILVLLIDVLLLSIFLYFYGGYTNPFSMMFLVYTCIAALLLSTVWTWIVFFLSCLLYIGLFFFHISIPALSGMQMDHSHHHPADSLIDGFSVHLYGMLFSFLVTGVLITFFLTRMRNALDRRQTELLKLQLQALSSESMARISALAAQSAHELSTPITTMTLIVDSLSEPDLSVTEQNKQILILRKLVLQCRKILASIRERFQASADEAPSTFTLDELIQNVSSRINETYPNEILQLKSEVNLTSTLLNLPKSGLELTLCSIIDNAAKYGGGLSNVSVEIRLENGGILLSISDQGENVISKEQIKKSFAPFVHNNCSAANQESGLGIGIFLARQYLSSINGTLNYQSSSGSGTTAIIWVPNAR